MVISLKNLWESFLPGYKTYLTAGILVVLSGLKSQGIIDDQVYQALLGISVALGLASLRAAR